MSHEAVSWAMDEAPMLRTPAGKPDATARWVLTAVAERADKYGRNAHPSIADIRFRTGWDRSTVLRALKRLEDAKLIVRTGVTKEGCARWNCSMDMRRPETDREEVEREEDAFRSAAAVRKRRSREKAVTHSEGVTGEGVTDSEGVTVTGVESVTEADVTHSESVTGEDVTHFKSGRHTLKVRDTADVTHSTPGRHTLNATRTTLEPPRELTTLEPPGSEFPPSSEFPPGAEIPGEQATIDGEPPPPPKPKRGRPPKPKPERTPEQQTAFDAADKIGRWWWDVRCPKLGIPVKDKRKYPGFRAFLEAYLLTEPPCSPQEVQAALETCAQSWPTNSRFEAAIRDMRGKADTSALRPTGTDGRSGQGGARSQVNNVDWSKGFNMGGNRR